MQMPHFGDPNCSYGVFPLGMENTLRSLPLNDPVSLGPHYT